MKNIRKVGNLYKGIRKICKKYKISYQKERTFNGDLHIQFRKKVPYSQNDKYAFYSMEYAECFISEKDLENRFNFFILQDLKGFLKMSFKNNLNKKYTDDQNEE